MVTKKKITIVKAPAVPLVTTAQILQIAADLDGHASVYEQHLETFPKTVLVPQNLVRVAFMSPSISRAAGRFGAAFSNFALERHKLGAGFAHETDPGDKLVAVTFPSRAGAITPKWREEAERIARELAEVKGETFDEKEWEAQIRSRYTPGAGSTSVKLEEVA